MTLIKIYKIKDFSLLDQLNREVNIEIMHNKVIVADFFFVSCPSICPIMTNYLKKLHDVYKEDSNVLILSHTVWPEMDSVDVLFKYANDYNVNHESWRFLTGSKKELYRLARNDYLVAPEINDPNYQHGGEADFIHTENIVLIDKKQRIRSFYDGTDSLEMNELINDIPILLKD